MIIFVVALNKPLPNVEAETRSGRRMQACGVFYFEDLIHILYISFIQMSFHDLGRGVLWK